MPYALFVRNVAEQPPTEWELRGMYTFIQQANEEAERFTTQDGEARIFGLP